MPQCSGITKKGTRCQHPVDKEGRVCHTHYGQSKEERKIRKLKRKVRELKRKKESTASEDNRLKEEYAPPHWKSASRIAGEKSEAWLKRNIPCAYCGGDLEDYRANKEVKDFECLDCGETYQLKSSENFSIENKNDRHITSSSYDKWKQALENDNVPNILILSYQRKKHDEPVKTNTFEAGNTSYKLRGIREIYVKEYVDSIYLISRSDVDEDMIEARERLGYKAQRNGWRGSYIVFDADQATLYYDGTDVLDITP